jgi:LEA14-like dessication related protein
MKAPRAAWSILLLLMPLLSGCSLFVPKITTPNLSVVKVSMLSADLFNQKFLVRVHVDNPNDRELPIKGIDYELFLQGDSFAEGITNAAFVVPARGETEFDMTVRTNFISSIGRLLSRLESGATKVEYAFNGKVMVDSFLVRDLPFTQSGSVDLQRFLGK